MFITESLSLCCTAEIGIQCKLTTSIKNEIMKYGTNETIQNRSRSTDTEIRFVIVKWERGGM